MDSDADADAQLKARLAGLFYLVTIGAGIFAQAGSRLAVLGDSDAATAANIAANTSLYRAGEAADLVMLCSYVVVTALLYELFARTERTLSVIAAGFSLMGIAVLAANGGLHLAPLALLESGGLPTAQRDALIGLSLTLHGALYGVSLVFFGVYCVLLGVLTMRTRLAPRPVGVLLALGGLVHVLTRMGAVVSPEAVAQLPKLLNLAPLLGEASLALWLLLVGRRPTGA